MNLQTTIATGILDEVFKRALKPATQQEVQRAPQVAYEAAKELAPVLVNMTNNEPWWQSRVTWGAIAAILGGLGTMAGLIAARDWTPNLWLTALGGVGGGVGTLYGRWVAKKPLALPGQ